MSDFSTLEIGKRALLAQRLGLDLTSNNIANVNTPGYSRRDATLQESSPYFKSGAFLGTGVLVDKLRSFREEFFDREIRSGLARQTTYASDEKIIQRIESIIAEPSDEGIGELVGKFFNTFEELSLKPDNVGLRESVLGISRTIVDRFHTTYAQLNDQREQVLSDITGKVNEANQLIEKIAKLNKSISSTKGLNGNGAQTYIDQREGLLEDLSKSFSVTATQNDNGTVNVFINGIGVVTANYANKLKALVDVNPATGEKTVKVAKVDENNNIMNILSPTAGEVSSLMKAYNVTLDENDSSGEFSVIKKLNEFASAFARGVNNVMLNGYGLDDTGPVPPGRSFFNPVVGTITAGNIALSADVINQPRNIALSDTAGEAGNNAIARRLTALGNDTSFLNGFSPTSYYANFVGGIGSLGSEASSGKSNASLIAEQLINQRESVIGVNLDEEAVNLIKYQKSFEAASRVINTTNEILATIVNLGR